jgi:hypothetical protein
MTPQQRNGWDKKMTKEELQMLEMELWKREHDEWTTSNCLNINLDRRSWRKGFEAAIWIIVEHWQGRNKSKHLI